MWISGCGGGPWGFSENAPSPPVKGSLAFLDFFFFFFVVAAYPGVVSTAYRDVASESDYCIMGQTYQSVVLARCQSLHFLQGGTRVLRFCRRSS